MAITYETRVLPAAEGSGYDFECACGFSSRGWNLKKYATARGDEHTEEHTTGEPAREIVEFRAEYDLNGPVITEIKFGD